MAVRVFRVVGLAYGVGFARCDLNFTFMTNEADQELVWAQARREAKKHTDPGALITIKSLKEVSEA